MSTTSQTCKSREELARDYGVSRRTLYTWFKKEQLKFDRGILRPIELEQVYKLFGYPTLKRT